MNKRFAIQNKNTHKYIEFFEYSFQADKYIQKKFNASTAFKIVDMRKK